MTTSKAELVQCERAGECKEKECQCTHAAPHRVFYWSEWCIKAAHYCTPMGERCKCIPVVEEEGEHAE